MAVKYNASLSGGNIQKTCKAIYTIFEYMNDEMSTY